MKRIPVRNSIVLIRDTRTHADLMQFKLNSRMPYKAISYTPDGSSILCVGPGAIGRWDTRTGTVLSETFHDAFSDANTFVISPDCSALAADNKIIDVATGEVRFQIDAAVGTPAFSPNGYHVAALTPNDDRPNISVFRTSTGTKDRDIASAGFTFRGHGLAYTSDNRGIISVSSLGSIVRFDARTGAWSWTGEKIPRASVSLAATPDGTKIVSAAKKSIGIWDAFNGKLTLGWDGPGKLVDLAVTDNLIACVSSDGKLCVWDTTGVQTESQLIRETVLREVSLVNGNREAAVSWLKNYRATVKTDEANEVVSIGLFHSYRSRSKVTDEYLPVLVNFPQLERLDLTNSHVTDDGLKQLAHLRNLRDLTLIGTSITDVGIHKLGSLKSLEILNLESTNVTDAAMTMLARHQSLQKLYLGGTQVTEDGIKDLSALKDLRGLSLGGIKITDEGLKHLSSIKTLESLSLWNTEITDEGAKYIAQMPQLTSIAVGKTQLTNAGMSEIAKCKTLRSLNVSGLKLTFEFEELAQLKDLRSLDLEGTLVSDQACQHIAQLSNLTTLNLIDTEISDEAIKWLSRLKNLETVYLRGTKITEEGMKRLQRALPDCDVNQRWVG